MAPSKKAAAPVVSRDLERDIGAAKVLKAHVIELLGEEAADAITLRDAIEGETSLFETFNAVVAQIAEDEAAADYLKRLMSTYDARRARLERRAELLRTTIMNALDTTGDSSIKIDASLIAAAITERAIAQLANGKLDATVATITAKAVAPKLVVTDEPMIPTIYWKPQDPVLDRSTLVTQLKSNRDTLAQKLAELDQRRENMDAAEYDAAKEKLLAAFPPIPGAELSNGSMTVQIRLS